MQGDRKVVLEAFANSAHTFEYASPELKSNRDAVLKAAAQHYISYRYALPEMQSNLEVLAVHDKGKAAALGAYY